jgi:hypothetical protein
VKAVLASWRRACAAVVLLTTVCAPQDSPHGEDFVHDVLPVLQRAGCSSAYCHGSATGRNGFRLSLFGSDAASDFEAITTQFGGRRLDLREPDSSLLLQKALGKLAHGGGRRLTMHDDSYQRLRTWVAAGAPFRGQTARELVGLEVALVEGRAVATARFQQTSSGGARSTVEQDVSDVALFATSDPLVVEVAADGALTYRGKGQAHITARFGMLTAIVRVVRAFDQVPALERVADASSLDRAYRAHMAELGLSPAKPVSPTQLVRRLHLDLVGRPPTPQELDQFVAQCQVAGEAGTAIASCITRLSARREFAEVWGEHLADWFELSASTDVGPAAEAARRHRRELVDSIAQGLGLPAIARRLVLWGGDRTATSTSMIDRFGDARDRAEYAGRTLLGMRIGCARCHDHPSDRWRQSEHAAFSACFAAPRADEVRGMMAGTLFDVESGEPVTPNLLNLTSSPAAANATMAADLDARREQLTEFLLSRSHDGFAKNASNRIFAILFGRGLVQPVDDLRFGNPPLDADMLAALVAEFHRCAGRLPDLLQFVMCAAVYAAPCSSDTTSEDHAALTHLASQASRALPPRTYLRSLAAVVGREPTGTLPEAALAQELALRNGPLVRQLLSSGGTTIDATFELCSGPEERLLELWRTVLSRAPSARERERFLPFAGEPSAYRDLAFALLTGREFRHRR